MAAPYPFSTHPFDSLEADEDAAVAEREANPDGPCEDRLPGEGLTDLDYVE